MRTGGGATFSWSRDDWSAVGSSVGWCGRPLKRRSSSSPLSVKMEDDVSDSGRSVLCERGHISRSAVVLLWCCFRVCDQPGRPHSFLFHSLPVLIVLDVVWWISQLVSIFSQFVVLFFASYVKTLGLCLSCVPVSCRPADIRIIPRALGTFFLQAQQQTL